MALAKEGDALMHHECVAEATVEILGATCSIAIEIDPTADHDSMAGDGVIVCVISLLGDVEWSLCMGLPRATAESMTEHFAGFPIPFDSPDMGDAAGELINILAGEVKERLLSRDITTCISLPSVIRGERTQICVQHGQPAVTTHFKSDCGPFWIEVIAAGELVPTREAGK